jgi:signal transduction histidine kinase
MARRQRRAKVVGRLYPVKEAAAWVRARSWVRPLRAIAADGNRERLLWAVRVRWLAIGGFSVLAVLGWSAGVLPDLRASAVAGAASAAINAVNHWSVYRGRFLRLVTAVAIIADVLLITYLIVSTGGTESPFIMLYVVQVVATAMLVDLLVAAAGALASAGCFLAAVWGHPVAAATARGTARQLIWGTFLLYCLALLTYLGGYIAERLRRSEGDLAERNRHLRAALASLESAHADLQRTVDRLTRTEAQLVHSEKMRALGQFVAGIAHELNNPIGFVAANLAHVRRAVGAITEMLSAYAAVAIPAPAAAALAARGDTLRVRALQADLPSALDDCEEGARRAAEIVAALRVFARADPGGHWGRADLHAQLERTLALVRHRLGAVRVIRLYAPLPPIECVAGQLDQVWMNVLANAVDAVDGRGTITVRTSADADATGAVWAVVAISDDGCGMPPDVRAKVFDPFFTTKAEGEGMGLGLSVSFGIVERHGGAIAIESVAGAGTTVTVRLPLARRSDQARAPGAGFGA